MTAATQVRLTQTFSKQRQPSLPLVTEIHLSHSTLATSPVLLGHHQLCSLVAFLLPFCLHLSSAGSSSLHICNIMSLPRSTPILLFLSALLLPGCAKSPNPGVSFQCGPLPRTHLWQPTRCCMQVSPKLMQPNRCDTGLIMLLLICPLVFSCCWHHCLPCYSRSKSGAPARPSSSPYPVYHQFGSI